MKLYVFIILSFAISYSCKQKPTADSDNQISKNSTNSAKIINEGLGMQIDSLLHKEMDIGFSGTVVVSVNDKLILQNGYGWTDSLKTVSIVPSTKFYLASTTKGITGTIALISQQKGLLSVYDSLSKFYPNCPKEFSNISIHNMLIHMSGLSNEYETFGLTELEENVALIFNKLPKEDSSFIYTSAGFWLTAAIIEKVANTSYEEYAHQNLFDPASMSNSSFWFEEDVNNQNLYAQKLEKFPPNDIAPNWGFRASSGITTNIIDLENYLNALTTGKLLNEESLNQLFGPHKMLGSGIGVGYGWFTTRTSRGTTEIWSRGGEGFGHNSAIRWFKDENVSIIILTNCGQIEGEDYEANKTVSDKIENLIFKKAHNNVYKK